MSEFCKNCGNELNEGSNKCPYCGTNYNENNNNQNVYQSNNQNVYTNMGESQNLNNNTNAKYNTNAIIGFVCSIIGLFCLGIVLGIGAIITRNNFSKTY